MFLSIHLLPRQTTTSSFFEISPTATQSSSVTAFAPYFVATPSSNSLQSPADTSPNWPIYLGLTLGTLGFACLISLALWIRAHHARRNAKKRKNAALEEPLPMYQVVDVGETRVEGLEGPPPPAYSPERTRNRAEGAEWMVPLSPPPAYIGSNVVYEQHLRE